MPHKRCGQRSIVAFHLDYALGVGDSGALRPRPVAHGEQVIALLEQRPPQLVQLVEVPAA